MSVENVAEELSDGITLIRLLETCSGKKVGRYVPNPRMRLQKLNNAKIALDFISSEGVTLANCSPERTTTLSLLDIVDGNAPMILGLVARLMQKYHIKSRLDLASSGVVRVNSLTRSTSASSVVRLSTSS